VKAPLRKARRALEAGSTGLLGWIKESHPLSSCEKRIDLRTISIGDPLKQELASRILRSCSAFSVDGGGTLAHLGQTLVKWTAVKRAPMGVRDNRLLPVGSEGTCSKSGASEKAVA